MIARKSVAIAVVAGATALGGVAATSSAWASPQRPANCNIFANNVTQRPGTNILDGVGGRQGCGDTVNLAVAMYKDISFWPDSREGSAEHDSVVNDTLQIVVTCDGNDPYYVTTDTSSGQSLEGAHTTHC